MADQRKDPQRVADNEVNKVVKKLGVEKFKVHFAKHITKSDNREVIEKWLSNNKGTEITFTV